MAAADADLDRQAQEQAEQVLEKLPLQIRTLKLPKVKEAILKRLRAQAKPKGDATATSGGQEEQSPPPPPPLVKKLEDLEGVEMCGDEPWFSDFDVRKALRDAVVAAHAEQKILVGSPAEEIKRICPDGDRILGAGAVVRLGGGHIGGYGESDISYAYRHLSRVLHPDKVADIPNATDAFKRLSDAAVELRRNLTHSRTALELITAATGRKTTPEMLERPQEALFAEATRMLLAIALFTTGGELPSLAQQRGLINFSRIDAFEHCNGETLLGEWYHHTTLLDAIAAPFFRIAYDCAPKRFRAHFLCTLNRVLVAESMRQQDCIRGAWQRIMEHFPELGYWRHLLEKLSERVWTTDENGDKAAKSAISCRPTKDVASKPKEEPTKTQTNLGFDDMDVSDDENQKQNVVKLARRTSEWADRWRDIMQAILPHNSEPAALSSHPEVRKLSVAMWQDIVAWANENGLEMAVSIFKMEPSQREDPSGAIHPAGPDAKWGYVPASDILLTVGEDIIGVTAEGLVASGPQGFAQETYAAVIHRLKMHSTAGKTEVDEVPAEEKNTDGVREAKASETDEDMRAEKEKASQAQTSNEANGRERSRSRSPHLLTSCDLR